jgi:hypothetical protein
MCGITAPGIAAGQTQRSIWAAAIRQGRAATSGQQQDSLIQVNSFAARQFRFNYQRMTF